MSRTASRKTTTRKTEKVSAQETARLALVGLTPAKWQKMSVEAQKALLAQAETIGEADEKVPDITPENIAQVGAAFRKTYGSEATHAVAKVRASLHRGAFRAHVTRLYADGILSSTVGVKGLLSAQEVADAYGVSRGLITHVNMARKGTHTPDGRRKGQKTAKTAKTAKVEKVTDAASLSRLVAALDSTVRSATITHTAQDVESLTHTADALARLAEYVRKMARPAATPADVKARRTA